MPETSRGFIEDCLDDYKGEGGKKFKIFGVDLNLRWSGLMSNDGHHFDRYLMSSEFTDFVDNSALNAEKIEQLKVLLVQFAKLSYETRSGEAADKIKEEILALQGIEDEDMKEMKRMLDFITCYFKRRYIEGRYVGTAFEEEES